MVMRGKKRRWEYKRGGGLGQETRSHKVRGSRGSMGYCRGCQGCFCESVVMKKRSGVEEQGKLGEEVFLGIYPMEQFQRRRNQGADKQSPLYRDSFHQTG